MDAEIRAAGLTTVAKPEESKLVEPGTLLASMSMKEKIQRQRKFSNACKIRLATEENMRLRLLKTFFCIRSAMVGLLSFSVAFDAVRCGQLNRMLAFIATPHNFGCFLPPLVMVGPESRNLVGAPPPIFGPRLTQQQQNKETTRRGHCKRNIPKGILLLRYLKEFFRCPAFPKRH